MRLNVECLLKHVIHKLVRRKTFSAHSDFGSRGTEMAVKVEVLVPNWLRKFRVQGLGFRVSGFGVEV